MAVTINQMLAQRNILRVISEFAKPNTPLCNFYGVQRGSAADRGYPGSDMFYWDVFNYSRTLASAYQPEMPPPVTQETQPYMNQGRFAFVGAREQFMYDRLAPWRPLGKPDGPLDKGGQDFVKRQVQNMVQRVDNTREFMLGQTLSVGTFSLFQSGEEWIPIDTASLPANTPFVTVDMGIPSTHKSQLDVFGTSAPIIDAVWGTASNDIAKQLFNLYGASEKKYGLPVTECWINSKTFNYLRINNYMMMGGLSSGSFIIYKSLTKEPIKGDYMQHGAFDVVFNSCPLITFHVLNRSYNVNSKDDNAVTGTSLKMTVPDDRAIFTPKPSRDWLSVAEGSRTIRPTPNAAPELKYGFHTYSVPIYGAGAAGIEEVAADSFLIYLLTRYAMYIATVTGF